MFALTFHHKIENDDRDLRCRDRGRSKHGVVAPDRVENAAQPSGQRRHGNPSSPTSRHLFDPAPQHRRETPSVPPESPRGLDQQGAWR